MTNREALNACSDKALVKFLLSQRGCVLCVVKSRHPQIRRLARCLNRRRNEHERSSKRDDI